jgi:hypothetical protein
MRAWVDVMTDPGAIAHASAAAAGNHGQAADYADRHPVLCAHADDDGSGTHWLRPGEKCTTEITIRNLVYQAGDEEGRAMQVWEAEDSDILVLREVLKLAESDPDVAGDVLCALYEQQDHDKALFDILRQAEEMPLPPLVIEIPA